MIKIKDGITLEINANNFKCENRGEKNEELGLYFCRAEECPLHSSYPLKLSDMSVCHPETVYSLYLLSLNESD